MRFKAWTKTNNLRTRPLDRRGSDSSRFSGIGVDFQGRLQSSQGKLAASREIERNEEIPAPLSAARGERKHTKTLNSNKTSITMERIQRVE